MKRQPAAVVGERFQWMRQEILTVVGGNYFYNAPIAVQFRENPVVWYRRDGDGRMLLNLRMLTTSSEPRLVLDDNDWLLMGTPVDFEAPPSGRKIAARYDNGDALGIEFFEVASENDLEHRYPEAFGSYRDEINLEPYPFHFPIAVCEIMMRVGGTDLSFDARRQQTSFDGNIITGMVSMDAQVGFHFG